MILSIAKFLHVICGVSFFGIMIAAFFYITRSIKQRDQLLINYSVRASYIGDAIILLGILIQIVTSRLLVSAGHFTLDVPWIFIAYHAFGVIVVLWLFNFLIKKFYFSRTVIPSYALKIFYFLNIAMIFIFVVIIHDAVMHNTGFDFLFRK